MDINLEELLNSYRSHPFEDHEIETPHCGVINLEVQESDEVKGPGGQWMHKPGSLLFTLERERNNKKVSAPCSGHVADIKKELNSSFVEAGERVLTIRHRLNKEEVIDRILREVLAIFSAPQTARYMLIPDLAARLDKKGESGIILETGDEILIMSLMKRDTIINYTGDSSMIYRVYFQQGDLVEQGMPLLGLCQPDKIEYVNKVISRIKTEWDD